MDRIHVHYQIRAPQSEARAIARGIALEQTVEVPENLIDARIEEEIVGRIESLEPVVGREGFHRAQISYDAALSGYQIPQLLNLIYGNTTMHAGIRVVDLELPPSLLSHFRGPNYGVDGLRELLGVYERPLLASALKPKGASVERLSQIAYDFARGGGDIIKDDQNLVDHDLEAYRERVSRCQDAVQRGNGASGRRCLYFPYVGGPHDQLERQMEILRALDIRGYLIAPMLVGMETTRYLAARYSLVSMAHPSLSGVFYISPDEGLSHELLLGTLFRLIGADISVFTNAGGRFRFEREDCLAIARRLAEPMGALAPAFPSPAGGMRFDNIAKMAEDYGKDSVLLIGGALLGHAESVAEGTQAFLGAIREHFQERLETPREDVAGSCDLPSQDETDALLALLVHRGDFSWDGRAVSDYKLDQELPFEGVRRVELLGKNGERTSFDLRYFEVAPGGFTSLEKHVHTHTIIGVRGLGVLHRRGELHRVAPLDVAYVAPLELHQLRNESDEPFGFFCIVDHERDKGMKP